MSQTLAPSLRCLPRPAPGKRMLRAVLTGLFPTTLVGESNWPHRPSVIVANHISFLDGLMLAAIAPHPPLFAVTGEFTNHPLWGAGLRALRRLGLGDFLTVDPETPFAMRRMLRSLRMGQSVVIFPEGAISQDGGLGPVRPGAAVLAHRAQVPIVPVRLDGLAASIFGRVGAVRRTIRPRVRIEVRSPIAASPITDTEELIGQIGRALR